MKPRRHILIRYGLAVPLIALPIATVFLPGVGISATNLLFVSIFLAARIGGVGAGIFATLLGTSAGVWMVARGMGPLRLSTVLSIGIYTGVGLVLSLLVRSMERQRRKSEAAAAEAARQSERLLTTLRSIGDAVIVADEGGRVASLNPVAEALTGWAEGEARGHRLAEVYRVADEDQDGDDPRPSDSSERALRAWGVARPSGRALLMARGGKPVPIEETAATIRDAEGKVRGAVLVFRDVSDRREAERRLSAAEARFRAFMDHSPVVAYIKDEFGRYTWGNAAWGRLHPGGVESALGRTDFELWPADTALRYRQGDRAAMESGAPVEVDEPSTGHDGRSSHWLSIKFRIGDEGRPLLGGISVDATERMASERALRESEERYRALFDSNPVPMWVYDVETLGFLAVNEAAVRRYGYSREEFLAMTIAEIRPPEDLPRFLARVAQHRRGERAAEALWRHRTRSGEEFEVAIDSHPIRSGGRTARLVQAHDVTSRRRDEEALRVGRERLDLALDAAELGVWYNDLPDGSLALNDRARAHHGIGPDGPGPTTLDELAARAHPDDRARVVAALRAAIDEGGAADLTYRVPVPGDESPDRWVRAIGRAYRDGTGRLARFDGVTLDVTPQREAEARLRDATAAAIEADRAKDQFLAVLGHELRTPLTPILVAVSTLLDTPAGSDPALVREALAMIRRNVELETRLIGDLLDVARVRRGRLRLATDRVDLHRALREAVDICRDAIVVSGLVVRLALAAEEHHVEADRARVLQIAWNLIHNAAKFSPPNARLTIRTANVDGPDGATRIVVEFQDQGAGMSPEALERVFLPFEQGDAPARRRATGLGLGLAISRSIAEAHGGTLEAESDGPGLGSTFRLVLDTSPRPGPAEPEPEPAAEDPPAAPRSVLLVEDDADTRRYLASMLARRGYRVETASRLAEASEAVDRGGFDLMISDLDLPDGSGLDLMRSLRGRLVGLAISGFGSDDDVARSRAAGFSAHLTKPLDLARLESALRAAAPGASA